MSTFLRNFLVIFLVLLQLIAPLVHAHVDEHFTSHGWHVPGLENHATTDTPTLQALHCAFNANNLIITVDTGLKDRKAKNLVPLDPDQGVYWHHPVVVFKVATDTTVVNFSPQITPLSLSFYIPPFAPRAPPIL